jgi:hypothetical protein
MGWLFDIVVQFTAEVFGYQVGKGKPWWIEWLASFGCLLVLGILALPFLLFLR